MLCAAPVLDVDWSSHNAFATCSTDQMIYVCRVGEQQPVHRFEGHSDEVNAVKWDCTGAAAKPPERASYGFVNAEMLLLWLVPKTQL